MNCCTPVKRDPIVKIKPEKVIHQLLHLGGGTLNNESTTPPMILESIRGILNRIEAIDGIVQASKIIFLKGRF